MGNEIMCRFVILIKGDIFKKELMNIIFMFSMEQCAATIQVPLLGYCAVNQERINK